MKSNLFKATVASLLFASAGAVVAAEPVALTAKQMDSVAAGLTVTSTSSGVAAALVGFAATGSDTSARATFFSRTTRAGSVALASGILPVAATTASSTIRY